MLVASNNISHEFTGLSVTEAGKLTSYMHFRENKIYQAKSLKEKADLDPSIDFLDCVDEDIPKGKIFILIFFSVLYYIILLYFNLINNVNSAK